MKIATRVTGTERAERRLEGVARRAKNLRPAWPDVTDMLRARQRRLFRTQGDGSWRPLKADTRARKRREGQPGSVLVATGKLERSLTRKGAAGSVARATKDSLQFGTNVHYARFQAKQDRNAIGDLSRRERNNAARLLADYINRGDE